MIPQVLLFTQYYLSICLRILWKAQRTLHVDPMGSYSGLNQVIAYFKNAIASDVPKPLEIGELPDKIHRVDDQNEVRM